MYEAPEGRGVTTIYRDSSAIRQVSVARKAARNVAREEGRRPSRRSGGASTPQFEMTMGAEAPTDSHSVYWTAMSSAGLKRPLRNAHHWRLWFCADYVRRLSGCLLTFARPVETSTPPPKRTPECPWVEVRGIEPLSRTPPDCRDYNHDRDGTQFGSRIQCLSPLNASRFCKRMPHPARSTADAGNTGSRPNRRYVAHRKPHATLGPEAGKSDNGGLPTKRTRFDEARR